MLKDRIRLKRQRHANADDAIQVVRFKFPPNCILVQIRLEHFQAKLERLNSF